ncbi:MAG TPA: DUF1848 domain-containing protein [Bacteroidetes bacterium]|nr:DUF1848 domain-containing protein [Bacteroidota bacterium]
MIISVSRRTDIPAFYGKWFMKRVQAGYCLVRNPFNPKQVSRISLQKKDVDAFVFWTRNARPFLKYLRLLEKEKYPFYFLYTVTGYSRDIERHLPRLESRILSFQRLSGIVGFKRMIWRYDPIIISREYSFDWHRKIFTRIAKQLSGHSQCVIISFVDYYRKTLRNLSEVDDSFIVHPENVPGFAQFMRDLADIARQYHFEITSCAEEITLQQFGISPGKCIDDRLLASVFDVEVSSKKDSRQRKYCNCVASRDIGAYNSCPYGCLYCYATDNPDRAKQFLRNHNPDLEWLV